MSDIPRSEHPRPDFERENWLCLNGEWDFSFDKPVFDRKITVPFACETELSGINDKGFHPVVWYRRSFTLPEKMKGKRIILHFGAVDYESEAWVNGASVCRHTGGQTPFFADITDALSDGENEIMLRACDDPFDMEMPRGKQFWEKKSRSIFYSRTTGIWQSVWLEAVSVTHLESCRITPLLDELSVRFDHLIAGEARRLEILVTFKGQIAACAAVDILGKSGSLTVRLDQQWLNAWNFNEDLTWSPETPRLFDVEYRLYDIELNECDRVRSYFGMRKVSIENGVFMLNNRPYFQTLVLDQGYWESSLLTAPTDGDLVRDIELTKQMGFNGVRKHQKVEDPRYLYHADRLGLLVWGEIGGSYVYSNTSAMRLYSEWQQVIKRDHSHPCIVVWTPLNESWGVQEIAHDKRQQAHSLALVNIIRSLDGTRPVVDNDGWEHTSGDLLTVHDYSPDSETLMKHFADVESVCKLFPGGRRMFADGFSYAGQPVLVTEFGGIRYVPSAAGTSWGYSNATTQEDYLGRLSDIIGALKKSPLVQGYCYTQLTDIENEENGLLRYDRSPKVPLEKIKEVNER